MNLNQTLKELKEITKLGDIKKIAKTIKIDHNLGLQLMKENHYYPLLLSILILDKKMIEEDLLIQLVNQISGYTEKEQNQMIDWLLANQLMKDKKLIQLMLTWQNHDNILFRRLFWYYQARLRWTGKTDFDDTEELLKVLEKNLVTEAPQVQWAMNFFAGQIGIFVPELRSRCIALGEKVGLYKNDKVSKGCTPSYLPEFIRIEVEKRENN